MPVVDEVRVKVNVVGLELEPIVTTFPEVPVTNHLPITGILLTPKSMVCATVLVEANSPIRGLPIIVVVDVPVVPPIVSLL